MSCPIVSSNKPIETGLMVTPLQNQFTLINALNLHKNVCSKTTISMLLLSQCSVCPLWASISWLL